MVAQVAITTANDRDFYQVFAYTLQDGLTPISLNGATFRMGVRRTAQDAGLLFVVTSTLSDSGQIILVNGALGQVAVWIKQSQLLSVPAGTFVHSLIAYVPASGGVPALAVPIWDGTISISQGPSR